MITLVVIENYSLKRKLCINYEFFETLESFKIKNILTKQRNRNIRLNQPTYISSRKTILAQAYLTKRGVIGNMFIVGKYVETQ
jgi:hypothetical protein